MPSVYRLFFLLLILFLGCHPPATPPDVVPETPPQRIISTLPSITEVLFDIGLGDRIVGDSFYTKYPPETAKITKIGGLYDINHERMIALKPDLVILSTGNVALRPSLSAPVLIVDHETLSGMLDSYLIIGAVFESDILTVAKKKRQELSDKLNEFNVKTEGKKPIRTLIAIDRTHGIGRIQNLIAAGADSFLHEVIAKAGGENVAEFTRQYGTEGVIHLAPDVIIDIHTGGIDSERSAFDWQSLGNSVPAVRNNRILTLTDDFASIPGPRTPLLIEKIAQYFESLDSN